MAIASCPTRCWICCADNAVATSVVLRGIASFGPHHVLRSDQSLSLSEDSPIAVAAVDTADKMAALADEISAMVPRGLVTLERAHLGGSSPPPDAAKLTVYVGRQDRADGRPAYRAVCDVLHRHGFAGASVFLGVDGTARGQRKRARFFSRNMGVPVMIIAVGTGGQVSAALPELEKLLHEPLFTIERAQLCKRDGEVLTRPAALPAVDDRGRALWQKLMVYTSEAELHDGTPIHRAIVQQLCESGAASGATVLRGIWGFRGDHEPYGDKLVQLVRRVPVTTIVVDAPDADCGELRHHRPADRRARAGDLRAGPGAGIDRRRRAPRRHRAGATTATDRRCFASRPFGKPEIHA